MKKIPHTGMGRSDLGWLKSLFHFSFADYYNPKNMKFGVLRVINDDLIAPHTGFDLHPHRDMEIISYVIEGTLTHGDSMGNQRSLTRGQVQYMSAGTGLFHSEHNRGDDEARLLQIWILPDRSGHTPSYGDFAFPWSDRVDRWLHILSDQNGSAPVKIHQDLNIYVTEVAEKGTVHFTIEKGRQAYLVLIEGSASVDSVLLEMRDAAEITEPGTIEIEADQRAHIMILEMKRADK